ncbi:MAG: nicotinamide mononucleotide transporter [Candidatus Moranbacteria bacterium]|nr:nicotinamide mononucleotide transporter [Candidatus Moranbacteria bacterium]
MSYLEFFGTILNIAAVWLVARKHILNWPVGIVAVVLYGALFFQIRLYSDFVEQIYYLVSGFYGWWFWAKVGKGKKDESDESLIRKGTVLERSFTAAFVLIGTIALGWFMAHVNTWWPSVFPESASFPYLDAVTTVMSFAAQMLMIFRVVDSWYLWIAVDVIGIWLYAVKEVRFVSLLYAAFLVLATMGLIEWRRELTKRCDDDSPEAVPASGEGVFSV